MKLAKSSICLVPISESVETPCIAFTCKPNCSAKYAKASCAVIKYLDSSGISFILACIYSVASSNDFK